MIARTWHGRIRMADTERYHEYIVRTGVTDCRRTEGNTGVYLLQRTDGDETEFLMVTLWKSWEDIKRFAGDDVERAVYYPEDADYLLEMDPEVVHYEVTESTTAFLEAAETEG